MSLAHRLKELADLKANDPETPHSKAKIKALSLEIEQLRKDAGVPNGAVFRETPKVSKVAKPVKKPKATKSK